ncbi:hypothetical protein LX32DRAFT_634575 [Colletotrichum zoysiae]|uniref:Cell wall protein n=1 Tax=Colletotrichum zoysiae TaxID=1216348 RepID=A0AAD9HTS5_9PEZI|nr:hypothetical protein LX32DRAFT_634575 [Colletotrichum zoysiae]
MQSRIFTAAVAALSLSTVQCASVPKQIEERQIIITPGYIVTPGIYINPNTLGPVQSSYQTLHLLIEDVSKTINLVNQITNNTAGSLQGTVSLATSVFDQVTSNVGTILNKVTQLTNLITPILPPPTTPAPPQLPDIGGAAENVVRTIQNLTQAITAQLDALRAQALGLAATAVLPLIDGLKDTLQTALNILGGATALALSLAASATASTQTIVDRVLNAKVKLSAVLLIGLQQEVSF